ncbi:hypothetical protein EVAR_14259_1 [Eumeta japonica]|uniref:Uncharacterized protein n=1 Tax=Eumeta variegata TaxID=151549 RepID=A0A4C1W8P0_EUMVA|nr:hypothetical protein EVAR_14259_1 [Eumeta japonica]
MLYVAYESWWISKRPISRSASEGTVEKPGEEEKPTVTYFKIIKGYVRKVKYTRDIPFVKKGNYAHRVMRQLTSALIVSDAKNTRGQNGARTVLAEPLLSSGGRQLLAASQAFGTSRNSHFFPFY